jgi:ATP-dependent helicase/nuclease subunit B
MEAHMGLRIVYGRAGSGKTSFCYNEIKNFANSSSACGGGGDRDAGKPLLLIVPEQFSLQAEKNLARLSGAAGISKAEVLSFRRLAFRVFSEVGGITRRHLDSAGKSMLLFRILDRLGGELKFFSRAALRKGFTETLSDAITEFKRYDITPDELAQTAGRLEEGLQLRDKLQDLCLIYSEFEKTLHKNYLDADDDLAELYKKLDRSTQYDGAEIWIDEFSGFTPQEYKVIIKLLKKAARVTVCLCTDCLSDDPEDNAPMVFGPVRKTAARLLRLAAEEGISVERPVRLDGTAAIGGERPVRLGPEDSKHVKSRDGERSVRFMDSEALGHLEQNFYKYPYKKFPGPTQDICITASANPYSEVEDTARDIIRLCRECGYRYRDIAVTMRNPDSYSSIIKSVFKRYGIPFFLDGKRDIDGHPLIVFILSALEIFTSNWSYEAVFRYAKTGLLAIGRDELDILENYVLANGIRGNVWKRESGWDYPVDGGDSRKEPSDRETDLLRRIDAARRRLAEPLDAFRQKTKGGTDAVGFCTALYELLQDTGAAAKIEELSGRFAENGQLDKANEYRQVWNIVMDVFTQIVDVLGEETLGTERFAEILSAGFAGHKMSLIPPALDQVMAGSIERARSHDIKALYILGVNEGVLPGGRGDEGLLSDVDRDSLGQLGLELAGNTKSRALEERFMVYMALATPSRYLWLSYPAADRDGKALRPSRVISEVKRIIPQVTEKSTVIGCADGLPLPSAPEPVFDEMVSQLRRRFDGEKIHDGWKDIYRWFENKPEWKDKCRTILEGLDYTNQAQRLTGDRAARLYGRPAFTSISRMEAYASCPFSFYVKYGLKAKERRIFRFDPTDAGTFMHTIIDEFSRLLVKNNISWRKLDKKWCSEQVGKLVDRHVLSQGKGILGSSKRYLYVSDRLKRTVVKALMLISRHIEASSFEPAGYEVEFGENGRYPPITIELPSGECIKMTGRIDRIDSMTNEDGTYLRIIDYKSGNRALKLGDVYYGLQLQLLTYLDAVLGMEDGSQADELQESCDNTVVVNEDETQYAADKTDAGQSAADMTDAAQVTGRSEIMETNGSREQKTVDGIVHEQSKKNGSPMPAGVLYFRLNDPLVRCGRNSTEEEIEKAIMKELRMKGLVLADVKLIKEMDRELSGDSLIIPARINKDGSLGRSSAATMEQFKVLREHVRKLLASIGSGILNGDVAVSPYKKRKETACTYCIYSPVCQFDTAMKDNRYRILADLDEAELWRLMGSSDSGDRS